MAPVLLVLAVVGVIGFFVSTIGPDPNPSSASMAAASAPKSTERTAALPPLKLPADDAAHQSGMEWWYYNGILSAKGGDRYAFHVAVFVANGLIKHTVLHAALTDLQTGKRFEHQTRTAGAPAKPAAEGLDMQQDSWRFAIVGPLHVLRVDGPGFAVMLDLKDGGRKAVAHRAADSATPGLLDFGDSGISYYYSRPRMPAVGEITIAGDRVPVSGEIWFDHQWGDFDVLKLGWNWFALHLADGSDLMVYELFDSDDGRKVMTAGTLSNADGSVPLKPGDVTLRPTRSWTSPRTRIEYPVEWTVQLPTGTLEVKPHFADSEFDSSATSANIYWEGSVKATGSTTGEGFLELSGYDRLSSMRPNRNAK